MTDIDSMPAGPEMDALVAELMGETPLDMVGELYDGTTMRLTTSTKAYSADIAAAWEVVEKLDYILDLTVDRFSTTATFTWNFGNGNLKWVNGTAHTAPLAICRAALKVKMKP